MVAPTKIGIIGCGNICSVYLSNAKQFNNLDIVACADLDLARATAMAKKHGVPTACTVEELLADPQIEIVVNLTTPKAHVPVGLAILEAGKHYYGEKPLGTNQEEGLQLVEAAKAKELQIGSAPDTFLGGGIQTSIGLINAGAIGEPVATDGFWVCRGHESWHPDPEFYYEAGGGPMLDMGPYHVTALIALLGPVACVSAMTRKTFEERTITSEPKKGKRFPVHVPTHVTGSLEFASGALGTIVVSYDCWHAELPYIEIHGTEGSLSVPDPNGFGGPVRIRMAKDKTWREVPLTHGYTDGCRSIGVADMADALRSGRTFRANGAVAYHALDVMQGFHDAGEQRRHIEIASTCERPEPLPTDSVVGALDG